MSTQDLLVFELLQLEEEETAIHLAQAAFVLMLQKNAARRKVISKKLFAGGERTVQAANLDIVLVPAQASTKKFFGKDSSDCQEVISLEKCCQLESQATLFGEENRVDMDGLSMVTAPGLNNEENGSDCSSTAGRFSYCPYTDLLAIAAEAPWRSTPETDLDVCGADLNTTQDWDEPATALVTGGGAEELPQEDSTVVEQYSYCLYSDQAVIASEVSWLETQDALGKCSKAPIEFAQFENRTDVQPGLASKTTSVTSGSSTRTKKRKVYRPPAKGVSPRLSQEEVNKISLQRKKK